jgi:hypothetical protein
VVVPGDHDGEDVDFYGQVVDIYALRYLRGNLVYLLKCDWFDLSTQNLGLDKSGRFVSINTSRKWYKDDPFVLASQGNQVFYIDDMKLGGHWKIVQKITPRNTYDIPPIEEEASEDGEGPSNREAYQENESIELFVDFSSFDMIPLTRNDVEAYLPVTDESGPQQREVEGSDDSSESFGEDRSDSEEYYSED